MVHTPLAIAASPLAPAIELARGIPMEIVAAAVGALTGVALFGVVVLVFWRRGSRPTLQAAATDVVFIPPYPRYPIVAVAPSPARPSQAPSPSPAPDAPSGAPARPLGFVPSSALSARAFAKMGYSFDGASHSDAVPTFIHAHRLDEVEELETRASSDLVALEGIAASTVVPAPDSIPCALDSASALPPVPAVETGPMSAVTMTGSSSILAGAPIADLDLDDAPTEICEPYFEPPQTHRQGAPAPEAPDLPRSTPHEPRRRMAPPKIRPIPPTPPRHALLEPTPRGPLPAQRSTPLPQVVPPPRT